MPLQVEDEIIPQDFHRGDVDATEVVFMPSVREIGMNAFRECPNLQRVTICAGVQSIGPCAFMMCSQLSVLEIQDGLTIIGREAFWRCQSLREVRFPQSLSRIGEGAFSRCSNLGLVEGLTGVDVAAGAFDATPYQESHIENHNDLNALQPNQPSGVAHHRGVPVNTLLQRLRLRVSTDVIDQDAIGAGLQEVFSMMCKDNDFNVSNYVSSYDAACTYYSAVTNWNQASDDELQKVLIGDFARKVASLNFGEIPRALYDSSDKKSLREILANISTLTGDDCEDDRVVELEERFCSLFTGRRHPAAFYRTIAGLCPKLVVPVPAIAKLAPVYAWLVGVEYERALALGWYKLSRIVRTNLQSLLPGKTVYEVGVLAWYLAEAFRDDLGKNRQDALRRKGRVLAVLHESGLI